MQSTIQDKHTARHKASALTDHHTAIVSGMSPYRDRDWQPWNISSIWSILPLSTATKGSDTADMVAGPYFDNIVILLHLQASTVASIDLQVTVVSVVRWADWSNSILDTVWKHIQSGDHAFTKLQQVLSCHPSPALSVHCCVHQSSGGSCLRCTMTWLKQ